jgi:DNA-directed RNA polymerase subunit alpha
MSGIIVPKIECTECTENYGRFVVEPLYKGYGVTLGNSLRRVLLSSLNGVGITWVRIDGVQHEFSTIPHVKEDTIDFLLNLKAIRLHSVTNRPGKMVLDVSGEKEVKAGDIQATADFEIVNPDLHLATMDSSDAKIYAEFNVEIGRGYTPAQSSSGLPVGAIPMDAVFSPVSRVSYNIETVRLGEQSGQERLIVEVWTDGSLGPKEAVSESASIIIEQFSAFRDLSVQEGKEEVTSVTPRLSPDRANVPIEDLNLSTRTYNSLKRASITTLGQLLSKGSEGWLSLPGFGAKSREEVGAVLQELGISMSDKTKSKKKGKQSTQSASSEEGEE